MFDRKPDFIAVHMSAEAFCQKAVQDICHHRRRKSCRVGIDEEEQRFIREDIRAGLNQIINTVFQFPHLAARSSAVAGRIHNHRIVCALAADFALGKFLAVIHNPTDGLI